MLAAVAIGSVVAALAPTLGWLLVGRVIQGFGGAVTPLAFGIIRDEYPAAKRASAVGVISAIIAVGGGLGTVLAGPIVEGLGWRGLFWLPMILVLATALSALLFIPESPVKNGGRINWLAATLLAGWLVTLLLPLSEGAAWGWGSAAVIGLFVAAALMFAGWMIIELRTSNPVIDMRMMRRPAMWTTNLVALFFGATMFAVLAFVPQMAQTPASTGYGIGASVTGSGLMVVPMLLTMAVAGWLSGPIARIVSLRGQLGISSGLGDIGASGFAFVHGSVWPIAAAGAVFGLGLGLGYAAIASLVVQGVPAHQTGVAAGMNAYIRTIGGAIGTAVVGTVITSTAPSGGFPAEISYVVGFALVAALAIFALAVSFLVPRDRIAGEGDEVTVAEPAFVTSATAEVS